MMLEAKRHAFESVKKICILLQSESEESEDTLKVIYVHRN